VIKNRAFPVTATSKNGSSSGSGSRFLSGKLETRLVVFKNKQIRRILYNNEWWVSVFDVVEALTDSADPKQYIKKMRQSDSELNSYWGTLCTPLEILAPDGKIRETICANTEGIFRIIQSIPSPKAEPFKRWLAKVGYERVQEIEDPELANRRTREMYRAKGYSDARIEKRMRGIAVRAELTEEWKKRDVNGEPEYAILTSEISKTAEFQGKQGKSWKRKPGKAS
jgi:DNA-damage-inducible protein D